MKITGVKAILANYPPGFSVGKVWEQNEWFQAYHPDGGLADL